MTGPAENIEEIKDRSQKIENKVKNINTDDEVKNIMALASEITELAKEIQPYRWPEMWE